MQSVPLCDFGVVDIGIVECRSDMRPIGTAAPLRAHTFNNHDFCLISAIVVNKEQQRNFVMRGGPKNTWTEIQIAVADHGNSESARAFVRERNADSSLGVVSDAESAAISPVSMV